ncbi:hypothetical protein [Candidatus Entotheonella palauensis]|uniref:hypothetical protein n=1 Tax=Candidatus Entotheonella palauensis TaxID=93172 RepID=UPI000558C1FB|nr:hypothetical protein [Candidatus Entotheonella palauensis]
MSHGFVLLGDGEFITVNFPDASESALSGINDDEQVVGAYMDADGVTNHGFTVILDDDDD